MKQARRLLEQGLVAAVATDAHQLGDLQQAAEGLRWIDKKLARMLFTIGQTRSGSFSRVREWM